MAANVFVFILFYISVNLIYRLSIPQYDDPSNSSVNFVQQLIERLIGTKSKFFEVKIEKLDHEFFKISKINTSLIRITGSNAVLAAFGFHYYLKNYCYCHISWDSDQLNIPNFLPDVDIEIKSISKLRYYQNVCTTSYSFVWWNETRWEREIDWMALNGINLALAFSGQEVIWKRIYKKMNLSEEDINEHFTGPAFLSWGRMGNLRKWGGPLNDSWHSRSLKLQHFILQKMRSLDIIPVLPCFSGHVPRAFRKYFPNASMTLLPKWVDFPDSYCCPYILDPLDPLFKRVGSLFMEEMITEFGTDHYYQCDMFNEMNPVISDDNYLKNISKAVFQTMKNSDSNAVWILQGWMFVDQPLFWSKEKVAALLSGVPNENLIILDLQSELYPQYERLDFYFGKSFIWCMLHNFGGTLGLHGSSNINNRINEVRNMSGNSMIGIGLTPEGIHQNYVIYDLLLDITWKNDTIDLNKWFSDYSIRRYGIDSAEFKKTWMLLKNSVYDYNMVISIKGQYALCRRPSLHLFPWAWYNVTDILLAWDFIIKSPINHENYNYDLVDITRQVLQLGFDKIYNEVVNSFRHGNYSSFETSSTLLLSVLIDLEEILSTNMHFLLGVWLNDAKTVGSTPVEKELYEWNARNQITLWGPNGEILDYATKQWSGIVIDYYFPRWSLFLDYLNKSLISGTRFNQHTFDKDVFNNIEKPFTFMKKLYPLCPKGNTIDVARKIHKKWRHFF